MQPNATPVLPNPTFRAKNIEIGMFIILTTIAVDI